MAKLKIAITGSTGLVGSRIIELLERDFEFIPLQYENGFDVTNKEIVSNNLKGLNFDIFLHLAAYTLVDKAEEENELAYKINVDGTKNVFSVVSKKKKKFIYISTDYVFNGLTPETVFDESSKPDPIGVYGTSKYEGEKIISDEGMIIRIAYPYRATYDLKSDFVRKIKSLLEEGKNLKMITDSIITPTFIDDIAHALKYLMSNFSKEIFHIVGSTSLSPYDGGKLIAKTFSLDESAIAKTTFGQYYKDYAKTRPQYTPTKSIKNNFYKMKTFEEGLLEIRRQMS